MQIIKTVLFFLTILLAASCSDLEFIIPESDEGKEMISFSVSSDEALATRAGFHGGQTFIAMRMMSESKKTGATALYTRTTAKASVDATNSTASYSSVNFTESEKRYWDDAHGQYSMLSVYAVAIPNMSTDESGLENKLAAGSSNGSAKWGSNATNTIAWTVSQDQTKDDTSDNAAVVTAGSGTIDKEDLVYSNNIQEGGKDGVYRWDFDERAYVPDATGAVGEHANGPMMFIWETPDPDNPMHTPAATVGKFDKGHLVFKHALSRITVTLKKSTDFEGDGTFKFTDDAGDATKGGTITLLGMKTAGTLNLATGTWSDVTTGKINKMARIGSGETAAGIFMGQMLPGYDLKDGDATPVMEFTIDRNTYYITQDMLHDALVANGANKTEYGYNQDEGEFTMMPGKNYRFEFNVKKRKVEVASASLIAWEDVTTDAISMNNARIKLQVEERGTAQTEKVAFYKADDKKTTDGIDDNYAAYNWTKGYTKITTAEYSSDHWTTGLFWETSKDFYHFRALMSETTGFTSDDANGDYVTLTSGDSYTDVCWGAPMLDDGINEDKGSFQWLYGPTSGGFDHADDGKVAAGLPAGTTHQIYKAIGATNDPVKLTLFHVMSDLTFNIKTTEGSDKVMLYDATGETRTRLDLVGFYNGGKVLLGTGLVKTTGDASTNASPTEIPFKSAANATAYVQQVYSFGAVPQDLTAVKLYITTPDDNQYIVDLGSVTATTVNTNNLANPYQVVGGTGADKDKYKINRWYPGFKYTYNLTLRKTAINTTATLTDWEKVEASDDVWF